MAKTIVCAATAAVLLLSACSSRPREFVATLDASPVDMPKYQKDHEVCRIMVAEGQRSGFGARLASGTVGAATGVGVTALAFGGATYSSMGAALAATGAAMTMMPVVGVAAAWGLAKAQKKKKERELKDAMTLCLTETGYKVTGWEVARGAEKAQLKRAAKSVKLAKKIETRKPEESCADYAARVAPFNPGTAKRIEAECGNART